MSACIISSTIFQFMNKGSPYLATSIVPLICTNCRMFKTLKVRNCHCFVYLSPVCVLEFRHNSCVAAARPRWEDGRSVDHRTVREWGHRGDTCCTCTSHQPLRCDSRSQNPDRKDLWLKQRMPMHCTVVKCATWAKSWSEYFDRWDNVNFRYSIQWCNTIYRNCNTLKTSLLICQPPIGEIL